MPKKKPSPVKKKSVKTAVKKTARKVAKKSPPKKAVEKPVKKTAKKTTKTAKKTSAKTAKKAGKGTKAAKKTPAKTAKKTHKNVGAGKAPKKSSPPKPLKKKALKKTKKAVAGAAKVAAPKSAKAPESGPKVSKDDAKATPIVFSLDDVEELMASKKSESTSAAKAKSTKKTARKKTAPKAKKVVVDDQPAEQRVWGAASLADILGFNPAEKKKNTELSNEEVPKKWKKYYKLLVELRAHVRDELNLHTTDTLKHSSRDDAGDLSGYGSHQADAGTDTFDRDFALSLVSSEQEALNEIEEAILRIKDGTYGVCEVTGKAIPAARLTAVPFARFSVEGQAEYEKNLRRKVDRSGNTGLFGDAGDAPKLAANDDDE